MWTMPMSFPFTRSAELEARAPFRTASTTSTMSVTGRGG